MEKVSGAPRRKVAVVEVRYWSAVVFTVFWLLRHEPNFDDRLYFPRVRYVQHSYLARQDKPTLVSMSSSTRLSVKLRPTVPSPNFCARLRVSLIHAALNLAGMVIRSAHGERTHQVRGRLFPEKRSKVV